MGLEARMGGLPERICSRYSIRAGNRVSVSSSMWDIFSNEYSMPRLSELVAGGVAESDVSNSRRRVYHKLLEHVLQFFASRKNNQKGVIAIRRTRVPVVR